MAPDRLSSTQIDHRPGGCGFRPAFNPQIATDVDSQVILGVEATSQGSDAGLAVPMFEQVENRLQARPKAGLFDNGFAIREGITTLTRQGIVVYAPPPSPRKPATEGTAKPDPHDTPEVVQWRERMRTEEAKAIYKERAATAEGIDALGRARGLTQLVVRGTAKVLSTPLLVAIAHSLK